ncbi:hypothetical protein UYO_2907 [Lachnospiraceae bacterium JC7]|nr:hypothetical protein UYO_2907 [Lachnospiraceae bacterium JC7]
MKENKLYILLTSDTAEIYWYKPEEVTEELSYTVYLDGKECGKTDRTHYTIKKLKSNHKYRVKVEYSTNKKSAKAVKIDKVSFVTLKEKKS